MQVLIDCPEILTFERTWTFPFLPTEVLVVVAEMGKMSSILGSINFRSKEMGEFVPDPEWLDPDSMPELESCLWLDKSSSSSFDLEYLKQSCFNLSDLKKIRQLKLRAKIHQSLLKK
jgi:hypothetical protein